MTIDVHLAWHYWAAGQYNECAEQCYKTRELDESELAAVLPRPRVRAEKPLAEQPRLDSIRSDSGFAALLASVGHTASAPNAD